MSKEQDQPFTRRRHIKPYYLRLLDASIHAEDTDGYVKRQRAIKALNFLSSSKKSPNSSITERLIILKRRYPDLFPDNEAPKSRRCIIPCNSLPIHRLSGISYRNRPTLYTPLLMGFFERQGSMTIDLATKLNKLEQTTNLTLYFANKGLQYEEFTDRELYEKRAISISSLLQFYHAQSGAKFRQLYRDSTISLDGWDIFLECPENIALPIACVNSPQQDQPLMEILFVPKFRIDKYDLDYLFVSGDPRSDTLYRDGSIIVEWSSGKDQDSSKVAGIIGKIFT